MLWNNYEFIISYIKIIVNFYLNINFLVKVTLMFVYCVTWINVTHTLIIIIIKY